MRSRCICPLADFVEQVERQSMMTLALLVPIDRCAVVRSGILLPDFYPCPYIYDLDTVDASPQIDFFVSMKITSRSTCMPQNRIDPRR